MQQLKFHELFRKYRLRSEFETFTELGEALAEKGVVYENSIFSHWQEETRVPTSRYVILKLLEVFIEREAVINIENANDFLSSAGHGNLTEQELDKLHVSNLFFQTEKEIDKKLQTAKSILEEFPNLLQSIHRSFPQIPTKSTAKISYYRGRHEIRKIYQEALDSSEVYSYFNIDILKEALPENDELFLKGLQRNKNLRLRELYQDTPYGRKESIDFFARTLGNKNFEYKFLPININLSAPVDTLIYDNKISFVNCGQEIYGLVIEDADYYENIKQLFDFMWRSLSAKKD